MSKQNPDSLLAVNHCPRCSSSHRSAKACNSSRHAYGAFPTSCGGEAWFDFGSTGPMPMPSLSPLAFSPFVCFVVTFGSPATAAFPILMQGRRPHWTFRGLLNVHSRYGLSARCIAKATHLSRRLRRFRFLHRRPDSYRLERPSCRVGIAPTEDQHLTVHGAQVCCPRNCPASGAG